RFPLLQGCVLHGLRGTACVRLLRAGANTRQIADMVGMSEPTVKRYTRFSEQRKNAPAPVTHVDERRTLPPSGNRNIRRAQRALVRYVDGAGLRIMVNPMLSHAIFCAFQTHSAPACAIRPTGQTVVHNFSLCRK